MADETQKTFSFVSQEPSSEDIQQQSFEAWVKGMELDLVEKTGEPVIDDMVSALVDRLRKIQEGVE